MTPTSVIPAYAGIQCRGSPPVKRKALDPRVRGDDEPGAGGTHL
jgi:hypothetical protein